MVLEVLNEELVVQLNSLLNFKAKTSYWGEVYGLDESGFIDFDEASKAVQLGLYQKNFNPEYTTTIFWREGGYTSRPVYDSIQKRFLMERGIIRGKFRCDTFVNYCYMKGLNVKLPIQPALGILPRSTYNSFLHKRKDVIQMAPALINATEKALPLPESSSLENKVHACLRDAYSTHQDKLISLWNIAKQSNVHEFAYLMDTFSSINAYELIPTFINHFHSEVDLIKKKKLVTAIMHSALAESQEIFSAHSSGMLNNLIGAQRFIIEVLQQEQDPSLLYHCIWHALSILPMNEDHYVLISEALSAVRVNPRGNLNDEQTFLLKLSMAFANETMQVELLPKLLTTSLNDGQRGIFDKQLLFIIKHLQPADIAPSIKLQLKAYVESINAIKPISSRFSTPTD